jgi:hypothetical protein
LNQSVEYEAVLINGTPKPMLSAINGDDGFIEMPLVAEQRRTTSNGVGKIPAKLFGPAPDGLVAHHNSSCRQQVLDHSQPQRTTEIEPDGLGDHLDWEAMTAIEGTANLTHAVRTARNPTPTSM